MFRYGIVSLGLMLCMVGCNSKRMTKLEDCMRYNKSLIEFNADKRKARSMKRSLELVLIEQWAEKFREASYKTDEVEELNQAYADVLDKLLDIEGDGRLSDREYKRAIKSLNDNEVRDVQDAYEDICRSK